MAVRFDAVGDYLRRTANVPPPAGFTICGWAHCAATTGNYTSLASIESSDNNSYVYIGTGVSGTALEVGSHTDAGLFSLTLAAGDVFFWAYSSSGTGAGNLDGYIRRDGQSAFTTATASGVSFTGARVNIGNDIFSSLFDGRVWNVKAWDRVLTATELLIESYYERPQFPTSLNFWWPLPNANDTADRSGNGRNATVGGTLTTEDSTVNLWRPSAKLLIPVAAPSGGLVVNPLSGIGGAAAQPLVG